ncbi:hypothetical protein LSH36_499g02034 [Paralvinella palmiformis]|uniref:Sulfotransferase n=1 Tax=Paralvinella palmiformis TaxID=53620 RepID=A0AAD9J9Z9_9ANNE|nr:hypothetical protein LSH36_499g02034 [Paralvinella palmiformis]
MTHTRVITMHTKRILSCVLLLASVLCVFFWSTLSQISGYGAVYPQATRIQDRHKTNSETGAASPTFRRVILDMFGHRPNASEVSNSNGSSSSSVAGALTKHILLVTYYRGGSTFLGEIFAQHPDAFYWFEPLRGLLGNVYGELGEYKPKVKHFLNMEEQYLRKSSDTFVELSPDVIWNRTRVLEAVLRCHVHSLPNWLLSDSFVKEAAHMPKMKPFSACLTFARTPINKERCLFVLTALCSVYPITVLKTIRYPVYALEEFFARVPDAYVIYYVRDPRGIMSSRKELHHFRSAHLSLFAQNLCDAMMRNHEHFVRMREKFPDRLTMLRYEDLALSPRQMAERLYRFVGLMIPEEILTWIRLNTAERRRGGPFATKRNSSEAAMSWRQNLDEREKDVISDKCKDVLNLYGYSK